MKQASEPYRIVVGVDFSETSDLALHQALELASSHAPAELHAVHVAQLLLPVGELGYVLPSVVGVPAEEIIAKLRAHVDRVTEAFMRQRRANGAQAPERIVCHLRLDAPAVEVAQLAADLEADLVVLGTHGRRGLSRVLLGSVAEVVTRLAPCPVLVVRPKRVVQVPSIEPACPQCVSTRRETHGKRLWCDQHSERHGQRHTYHTSDRVSADSSMPLLFHG